MTILLRPIISEKSMALTKVNLYTFEVAKKATKPQIKNATEDKFGVKVLSIKTVSIPKKKKWQRSKKRGFYTQASIKKAVVQVAKGQKIHLFESVSEIDETKPEGENQVAQKAEVKEKKNLLKGTKVKIERTRGQDDLKKSHKEKKKGK